ncbi:FecR family protein [Steroidobacter flavus]|uniref:FecR family protein n=1 Tax=Steroidobacter flavus TaxID=1842136 RepID=A0ABV8T324_9GAMM
MNSNAPERRHVVLQEASEWLMRLQDDACTEAELDAWGQWMQASPQNSAAFDDVSALWDAASKLDSAAVLNARERSNRLSRQSAPRGRRGFRWSKRFVAGIAASFLVVAVAWFVVSKHTREADVQVLATQIGERRQVTLQDGSIVELDAATEVLVRYNERRRDVELRAGQAFFSVAHAPERPFVVAAGNIQGRALGTRFTVSHRADRAVAVTVVEGRVRVSQEHEQSGATRAFDAIAGQLVTFSDEAGLQAPRNVNTDLTTAWREGVVIYQGESLANVIADLNRYSRVPVRLDDPKLGQLKVTGRWELAAIDQWLDGLARASGTRIKRSANEVLLTRDPAQNSTEVSVD